MLRALAGRARFREWRRARRSRLSPWLAVAVAVHAGLFAVSRAWTRLAPPEHSSPSELAALAPIEVDLITPPDALSARAVATPEPPASEPPAVEAVAVDAAEVDAAGVEAVAVDAIGVDAIGLDAIGLEPAGPAAARAPDVGAGAAKPEPKGRGLSLRDLGVDRGSNPFIGGPADLPTERQRLNQRLRQSLRAGIAKQDQRRGLGPEGPAVAAVKEIVLASPTAPNTSALLRVRANGAGRVTHVEVLQADRDDGEWRRIAEQLVRALAGTTLRVPAKSQSVSFDLRVVSRVQLPSGADPGLAIDLFGIPVKEGDGERSTRLSLLSPVVQEVEVPHSNGARVPVVSFALIAGRGDLADIGAVARRLVTAYLVGMDTQSSPESSSDAAPPASATP